MRRRECDMHIVMKMVVQKNTIFKVLCKKLYIEVC